MSIEDNSTTANSTTNSTTNSGATPSSATSGSPSFTTAMLELESILERIDGDGIDIDQLATELRSATELLELCRGKIRKAEVEVNQIVKQLEDPSG